MNQDATPNPYEIPAATLATSRDQAPRQVPAMNGLDWVVSAWAIFRQRPGLFIGMTLLMAIINFALGMLPLIGMLASLLSPALIGGFALATCKVDRGEPADIGDLFAGFKQNFSQLLVVGAIFLGISFVLLLVGGIVVGICLALGLDFDRGLSPGLLVAGIMALMLSMLLIMMLFITMSYAAMMVMLGNFEPVAAYRQAFNAFWVNILPFLVFGVASGLLYALCMLPLLLGLIDTTLMLAGIVPMLLLLLLLVSPWMTVAIYTGVKDMFDGVANTARAGS